MGWTLALTSAAMLAFFATGHSPWSRPAFGVDLPIGFAREYQVGAYMCALSAGPLLIGALRNSRSYRVALAIGLLALPVTWTAFAEYPNGLPIGVSEEAEAYLETANAFRWMPGITCGLAAFLPTRNVARLPKPVRIEITPAASFGFIAVITASALLWGWVADSAWLESRIEISRFGQREYDAGYALYGTAYTAILASLAISGLNDMDKRLSTIGCAFACVGCMAIGWDTRSYGESCFSLPALLDEGLNARAGRAALANWLLAAWLTLVFGVRAALRAGREDPEHPGPE